MSRRIIVPGGVVREDQDGVRMPEDTPDYTVQPQETGVWGHDLSCALDTVMRGDPNDGSDILRGRASLSWGLSTWVANNGGVPAWRRRCSIDDDTWALLQPFIEVSDLNNYRSVPVVVVINVPDVAGHGGAGAWWATSDIDSDRVQDAFDEYGAACREVFDQAQGPGPEPHWWPPVGEGVELNVVTHRHNGFPYGPANTPTDDQFAYPIWVNILAQVGPFPTHTLTPTKEDS